MSRSQRDFDAIIIGAGLIGASIAYALAKRGVRPVVLDKNAVAGAGSTVNSSAVVRTAYSTWDGTALAYESYLHWRQWREFLGVDDERGFARFVETGMIVPFETPGDLDTQLAHHRALDIPFEEWDLATLGKRMPMLDLQSFCPPKRPGDANFGVPNEAPLCGAVYFPTSGYVNDPQLTVHNLQCAAEAHGARFQFNAQVTSIDRDAERVQGVSLDTGESLIAPVVVNASGPHSAAINQLAGVLEDMSITTRALRHEVYYVPMPPSQSVEQHGFVIADSDIGCYSRPDVGDKLLVGSMDPECDPQEWIADPDHLDRNISGDQWKAQLYRMAQRMPDLPIPDRSSGVVDAYDVSDDWIPVYDRSSLDGFYMAVGTSGNQFKNAPLVGQLMAELIICCEQGQDHDVEPVSFSAPMTGVDLDIGFYSRKRGINEGSSFTVMG
ncbi:MAG: FAD-dependent oxidoreductase [Pseudomonadota bacterium]